MTFRVALGVSPLEPDLSKAPPTLTTIPNPEITPGEQSTPFSS